MIFIYNFSERGVWNPSQLVANDFNHPPISNLLQRVLKVDILIRPMNCNNFERLQSASLDMGGGEGADISCVISHRK